MKKLLLLLITALCSVGLYAQPALGIGGNGTIFGISSTVCDRDTDVYSVYVKNKGNATFSGVIYLYTQVDSGTASNLDAPQDTVLVTLPPGDSVQMYHTHIYDTNDVFRMGGNIVVIWPSSQSVTTSDTSLPSTVDVQNCSSVAELAGPTGISIYPNPGSGNIMVHSSDPRFVPERMKLFDISGRELASFKSREVISLHGYDDGVYFLELTFSDNSRRTYKIVRKE